MELVAHLGRYLDPSPLLEGLVAVVAAGEAHELDVLHAAGHGEPTGHEAVLAGAVGLADLREELDGLARVLLRLVLTVHIPDAEILVRDVDDRSVDVKGQRVGDVVVGHAAVLELIGDVALAGGLTHQLVQLLTGSVVVDGFGAVEDDQLAAGDLVQHQRAHGVVAGIGQGGGAVGGGDALVDDPVLGQVVCQILQHPHTVVLDDHAACIGLLGQLGEVLGVQLSLVLEVVEGHAGEGELLLIIFLFALLADQQKGLVAGVEVGVFKGLLNELGLAALEEAHKQVYRDLICHNRLSFQGQYQQPNSAAMAFSSSLEPMTTSLPPTSAPRARTSHSPGT